MRGRQLPPLPRSFPAHVATSGLKEGAIGKAVKIATWVFLALVGTSLAALLTAPAPHVQSRVIQAGSATLRVPLHLPREVRRGGTVRGSVVLGSKLDCDITYDEYMAVHWADHPIPSDRLLPADTYKMGSAGAVTEHDLGRGARARIRSIAISAEKPCGKIVHERLEVIEAFRPGNPERIVITAMLNPVMTADKVWEIAQSLQWR